MKYSLRSLMIAAAVAPPILAGVCSLIFVLLIWPYQAETFDYTPGPPGGESSAAEVARWHADNPGYRPPLHPVRLVQFACVGTISGAIVLSVMAIAYKAFRRRSAP